MSDERLKQIMNECARQAESCLYTSTSLYIWLRRSRARHRSFIVAPIVLSALATWSVLDQPTESWIRWMTATFALLAGLAPAIVEALKLDVHIDEIREQAAEFKSLQDAFRRAMNIAALGPFEDLKSEFEALIRRLEAARSRSLTPPESCFRAAQKKIKIGDYGFTADETLDLKDTDRR